MQNTVIAKSNSYIKILKDLQNEELDTFNKANQYDNAQRVMNKVVDVINGLNDIFVYADFPQIVNDNGIIMRDLLADEMENEMLHEAKQHDFDFCFNVAEDYRMVKNDEYDDWFYMDAYERVHHLTSYNVSSLIDDLIFSIKEYKRNEISNNK